MAKPFLTMQVHGLKELDRALRELPETTQKSTLRAALKKAAQPIAEHAASLAPRATGRLAESIMVKTQLSKRQRRQQKKRKGDVVMYIGPGAKKAPHAHFPEFGTIKMPAQPFLRPAWDSGKDKVLDSIKDQLWAAIRKTARRLAKKAAKMRAA